MAPNFLNLKRETDIEVQEAQRISKKINLKKPTPRHSINEIGCLTPLLTIKPLFSEDSLCTRVSCRWALTLAPFRRQELKLPAHSRPVLGPGE